MEYQFWFERGVLFHLNASPPREESFSDGAEEISWVPGIFFFYSWLKLLVPNCFHFFVSTKQVNKICFVYKNSFLFVDKELNNLIFYHFRFFSIHYFLSRFYFVNNLFNIVKVTNCILLFNFLLSLYQQLCFFLISILLKQNTW